MSSTNPVVALCAAGMACEGMPAEALRLFEEAWAARQDDYDAAVAAHYVARHQPTPADTLRWNQLAVQHAELAGIERTAEFMASLYLNLGDSFANCDRWEAARDASARAAASLDVLPDGGYRDLVAGGIRRLQERVATGGLVR